VIAQLLETPSVHEIRGRSSGIEQKRHCLLEVQTFPAAWIFHPYERCKGGEIPLEYRPPQTDAKVSESSKLQSEVEVERPLPALTREPLQLLKMEGMPEIDNNQAPWVEGLEGALDDRRASLNVASGEHRL